MKSSLGKLHFRNFHLLFAIAAFVLFPPGPQLAFAQTSGNLDRKEPIKLEFEVSSLKPSPPSEIYLNSLSSKPGGKIVGQGCTLKFLIMLAFDLQDYQILGGADWIELERYHLEAIPPSTSHAAESVPNAKRNPLNQEQREMLQSLLAERFQLHFHQETRQGKIYILTANPKKLKLQQPKDKDQREWAGGIGGGGPDGEGLRGANISMQELSEKISSWLGFPVQNQTNLQGNFDFIYKTEGTDPDSEPDGTASIITSLNGVGLSLRPSTGPSQTLIIDSAHKPSED